MTANHHNDAPENVWAFLSKLLQADVVKSSEDNVPWYEPGKLYEIDEKTYWHFLELLPPRWIEHDVFAFGEGGGPLRILWQHHDAFFLRELTDDETIAFCKLSGTSLYT